MSHVLKGLAAVCVVALAGCSEFNRRHPTMDDLPQNVTYNVVVQPVGAAQAAELTTQARFGMADTEAPSGFAQLRLVSRLPEVVTFEYRCHVHGVDAIPQWVGDGQPCSAASSSYVQGFQVRLAGPSAKYYRVRYECSTVHKDGRGLAKVQGSKAAGDWCGVRDSATEEWVSRMVVWVEPVISF